MRKAVRLLFIATLSAVVVAGCQLPKPRKPAPPPPRPPAPAPQAQAPAPQACTAEFAKRHRLYTLPPTVAPIAKGGKGQPLQWAVSHPVGKPLGEISTWRDLGEGWSSIGLRLVSENASGLSAHLSRINIADAAQIWVCTPDGQMRRGPLRDGGSDQLSTPVLPGAELWLEVLSPTRNVPRTVVVLDEVYGGFR